MERTDAKDEPAEDVKQTMMGWDGRLRFRFRDIYVGCAE